MKLKGSQRIDVKIAINYLQLAMQEDEPVASLSAAIAHIALARDGKPAAVATPTKGSPDASK